MAGPLDKDTLRRLIVIRALELKLTKNFNEISGGVHQITIHDVTRKLLKEYPKAMKKIDKLVEEFDFYEKE